MSTDRLPLADVLAAFDLRARAAWAELTPEEQKSVNFWLLNRYMSSVRGSRAAQENAVLQVNNLYNKNWNTLGVKHPQLQWQLLCGTGSGTIQHHNWLGFIKSTNNNKDVKLLLKIYPDKKQDEVELLAKLLTKKELKQLAEQHGYDTKS